VAHDEARQLIRMRDEEAKCLIRRQGGSLGGEVAQ
jgi:hypothetical protein